MLKSDEGIRLMQKKVTSTKFDEGIRSGSSFNLSPINTLKFVLEIFKVLKGEFLRISTVTHCQVTNASFNNIANNLCQGRVEFVQTFRQNHYFKRSI